MPSTNTCSDLRRHVPAAAVVVVGGWRAEVPGPDVPLAVGQSPSPDAVRAVEDDRLFPRGLQHDDAAAGRARADGKLFSVNARLDRHRPAGLVHGVDPFLDRAKGMGGRAVSGIGPVGGNIVVGGRQADRTRGKPTRDIGLAHEEVGPNGRMDLRVRPLKLDGPGGPSYTSRTTCLLRQPIVFLLP